jgi:hypothetical protein
MLPPITKTVFGLRFGPLWQIGGLLGAIVDDILRGSGTPFGPLTFPGSQEGPTVHRLVNPETNDSLTLTERDIILSMSNRKTLEAVEQLGEQFSTYVLGPIRRRISLRIVSRYGMILEFANCEEHLKTSIMKQYLGDESDARDIILRYSRRLPTDEATFRKDVSDYRNLIYTLVQDQKTASIGLDYQLYFEPALDTEDWKKKPFDQFVRNGTTYAGTSFESWLKRFLKSEQVA